MRRGCRHWLPGACGHWPQKQWSRMGRRRQRGRRRCGRRDEGAFKVTGRRVGHVELRVRIGRVAIPTGTHVGNEIRLLYAIALEAKEHLSAPRTPGAEPHGAAGHKTGVHLPQVHRTRVDLQSAAIAETFAAQDA